MKITDAKKSDAPLIARSVMDAIGTEICEDLACNGKTLANELRKPFFEAVKTILDKNLEGVGDETDASEFYLDTLAVLPEYRGRGIAAMLLKGAVDRAAACGKPAGLLVDKENHRARKLYERVGFRQIGERPFCYVMMDHMQFTGE